MTKINNQQNGKLMQEELVKFHLSKQLKSNLISLAQERNITISALMRLIASEYVKRNKSL